MAAAYLWPVSIFRVVRVADECNLRQRALTALELSEDASPMAELQRQDALSALRALDAKRALPVRISRGWLMAAALCVALSGALYFVSNPQNAVITQKQRLRETLAEQAEKIEAAAEALPETDPDQLARLQKLARNWLSRSGRANPPGTRSSS